MPAIRSFDPTCVVIFVSGESRRDTAKRNSNGIKQTHNELFQVLLLFIVAIALSMSTASATSCVSTPSATEGPYYVSGMPFRKNITEGKSGLPVTLTFMKIFNGEKEVLTSQLFFSDTLSDQIAYSRRTVHTILKEQD